SLSINGSGFLDLNDGALIYDYAGPTPVGPVQSLLGTGNASGAWNGSGIRSTTAANDASHKTALGYAEATDLFSNFPATFANQPINDNTAVLVKYTFYGDANLDGQVNVA